MIKTKSSKNEHQYKAQIACNISEIQYSCLKAKQLVTVYICICNII